MGGGVSKELVLKDMNVAGVPAAQYIRMSTEHQRYSPDNQKAAIASFAEARGFEIVKTYLDQGKSGLTLAKRDELKQLLRSEEHTSELQSLLSNQYEVFGSRKKTQDNN